MSKNVHMRKFFYLASASLAGFLWVGSADAQQRIEQMIVTAQKRSQDIQTVPASISAFSGEGLEQRQIRELTDLGQSTPNVVFAMTSSNVPLLSIRGISPDVGSPLLDQTVALHVDGVYQPRSNMIDLILSDIDNIEILRGPQGTLYGRNANAGVINLNTKKPTDTFEASATLFGGSFNRYGVKGFVSGPVTNGISVRLSGLLDRSDGPGRNLYTGNRIDGSKSYGLRASIRLQPADDVTIDLSATRAFTNSSATFFLMSRPFGSNFDALTAMGQDVRYTLAPRKIYDNYDSTAITKQSSATSIITWDIDPNVTLKSTTGWQLYEFRLHQGADGMPASYIYARPSAQSHTISQEFNLSAKPWDWLDTVTGLYYLQDNMYGGHFTTIPPGNPVGNATTRNLDIYGHQRQDSKSKAIFFDVTVNVTDELRILAGIRRTFDDRYTWQDTANYSDLGKINGCGPVHHAPDLHYRSTTGKVGLQYDITPDVMAYVSWQNGFKTGGYNNGSCDNAYKPESVYSWEAGLKGTYFNDTVSLNLSVFDYKYSNMQLSRVINLSPTQILSLIDNAASASIKGAEIEGEAYIGDNLKVNLGIGIIDGKYGPLESRNGVVPGNPLVNMTGFKIPRAPDLSLNVGAEYTMQLGDLGELKTRGEYSYTSKQYFTVFNEDIAKQDGYSLTNLIFTFTPAACENLTFQAYVRNLMDKDYRLGASTSSILFFSRGYWGKPRTFGASVTAKF